MLQLYAITAPGQSDVVFITLVNIAHPSRDHYFPPIHSWDNGPCSVLCIPVFLFFSFYHCIYLFPGSVYNLDIPIRIYLTLGFFLAHTVRLMSHYYYCYYHFYYYCYYHFYYMSFSLLLEPLLWLLSLIVLSFSDLLISLVQLLFVTYVLICYYFLFPLFIAIIFITVIVSIIVFINFWFFFWSENLNFSGFLWNQPQLLFSL